MDTEHDILYPNYETVIFPRCQNRETKTRVRRPHEAYPVTPNSELIIVMAERVHSSSAKMEMERSKRSDNTYKLIGLGGGGGEFHVGVVIDALQELVNELGLHALVR